MHKVPRMILFGSVIFFGTLFLVRAQDPRAPGPPPPASTSAQNPTSPEDSSSKKKSKHADDFLIRGSIFTPEGISFAGAEVRIRRSNEKKFRWQTQANSRGEFAIRVKQGSDYQVSVKMKGYKEQLKSVDAKAGGNLEELSIRMEREGGASQ